MNYCNLHTHTIFSDGKNTVEENILSAIEQGMLSIGFSDHSYTDFDLSYCMPKKDGQKYIDEVRGLAEKYKNKIEVYLGLELDGFSSLDNRAAYDYIIGDCHYIKTPDGYRVLDLGADDFSQTVRQYFGSDAVALAVEYYSTYAECIAKIKPDILGHIDLVTKFGLVDTADQRYKKAALETLEASLGVTPIIELNTGAMSRGYKKEPYPEQFLLKRIKELNGKVLLCSDSHNASALTFFFDESLELLRACGFKSMVVYRDGKFEEVGI